MPSELYRHKKTGNIYKVVSFCGKIEATWEDAVIYHRLDEPETDLIARPSAEFFDGRFEPMGPAPKVQVFDPLADIEEFHTKFDLPALHPMGALDKETMEFRRKFLQEEIDEWWKHQCAAYDETTRPLLDRDEANYAYHLEEALDGLVDLAYVLFGTVYLHGFGPVFAEAWRRVHEGGNMTKVRAALDGSNSKRGSSLDVVKPAGWEKPTHSDLVEYNDIHESHFDRA
jgi:predicted HAD superfamily Cof-like phosphohydrolase